MLTKTIIKNLQPCSLFFRLYKMKGALVILMTFVMTINCKDRRPPPPRFPPTQNLTRRHSARYGRYVFIINHILFNLLNIRCEELLNNWFFVEIGDPDVDWGRDRSAYLAKKLPRDHPACEAPPGCCCDSCYPCDYDVIARAISEMKGNKTVR